MTHVASERKKAGVVGDDAPARRMLNTAVNVTETLTIIAEDPHGVPAKVLARRLGQSLSTTYYALQTLTSVGLVEPSPSAPGSTPWVRGSPSCTAATSPTAHCPNDSRRF